MNTLLYLLAFLHFIGNANVDLTKKANCVIIINDIIVATEKDFPEWLFQDMTDQNLSEEDEDFDDYRLIQENGETNLIINIKSSNIKIKTDIE